jgi:hypothetical protein
VDVANIEESLLALRDQLIPASERLMMDES